MRLIDADKLKSHYAWWADLDGETKKLFDTIIDLQPTVELKPIVIDGEEYLTGADYNNYLKGYKDGYRDGVYGKASKITDGGARMDEVEEE